MLEGAIYSSLRSLYEPPFCFGDIEIDNCLRVALSIDEAIRQNAEILAASKDLTTDDAVKLLVGGGERFPDLGQRSELPTIWDIAASIKPWVIYIEDEQEDRDEVDAIFKSVGLRIMIVEESDDFIRKVEGMPFIQYWIDLGLGPEGDVEIGKKLIKKIRKRRLVEVSNDIVVYTQHASARFLQRMLNNRLVSKIIDKSESDIDLQVSGVAMEVSDLIQKRFGYSLRNPLLVAAMKRILL